MRLATKFQKMGLDGAQWANANPVRTIFRKALREAPACRWLLFMDCDLCEAVATINRASPSETVERLTRVGTAGGIR